MTIIDLKTNGLKNSIGRDFDFLTLSWRVQNSDAHFSKEVRIVVRREEEICFDTGYMQDYRECSYYLDMQLTPRTRYTWKVWVKDEAGEEAVSDEAWFETGKLKEGWKAKWIGVEEDDSRMPILYKDIPLEKKPVRARLYLYGMGLYEAYANGDKIGEEFLQPGYHSYDCRLEYQTYDVTDWLREGINKISVMLGEGWYKGRFGFDGDFRNIYGSQKKCIGELWLTDEDGKETCIITDDSWKGVQSCVLQNNIYDGESIDDTLPCGELAVMEFGGGDTSLLTERTNPSIIKTESFVPMSAVVQQDNSLLLDFGEAITGWVEIEGQMQAGEQIYLQYGEVLQDNAFYRENLRTAEAAFRYTSAGEAKIVRPHFTYYGFRYVRVEGPANMQELRYVAYRLMSDVEKTGEIVTGNQKVNKLIENTMRSQKCNFLDIPTDCSQRDERMGWTGDVTIFAPTACFHADCKAFFRHYAKSLACEQQIMEGSIPFFVPRAKIAKGKDINPFYYTGGVSAWGDVATILPWTLYQYYGDRQLLREQYPIMCDWVDCVTEQTKHNAAPYLWQNARQLGDWLALDNGDLNNPIGKTDVHMLASAYYYNSVVLCGKAATVLKDHRRTEFSVLAQKIKEAFIDEYYDNNNRLTTVVTQTACAVLLNFGLYPKGANEYLSNELKKLLERNEGFLNTGFVGTPALCPSLSENGLNHMAYGLLLNEKYPGWLHEVNMGATTVWERWNSLNEDGSISGTGMNSLNHYAYGSISDWIYRYVCGIRPQMNEEVCVEIRPMPDSVLGKAVGTWRSPYGNFVSGWEYEEGKGFHFHLEIPFNARARVVLPGGITQELVSGSYDFDWKNLKNV